MTATTAPGLRLTLRPYQQDALDRIADAERRGVRRQLGVAATGLGKTIIFCALAAQRGQRTLILVHRDELVTQAVHKMREVWPGVDVGIVKAGENDVSSQVVVASVQTLSRPKRMEQLKRVEQSLLADVDPFDLIVVDEAHHAAAESYRWILDELDAGTDDGPLLLGVTATPDRGDGKGLDDLFDEIVWSYDILWGIRSGFLADVRGRRVELDALDLDKVKVSRGDYEAGASGRAMADAQAPLFIVKAWQSHAADRQTLVFTPTVELAQQVADEFVRKGVRAGIVSAGTPLDERRQLLAAYSRGDVQVLANCAVLTEGYDEPRTDCIVIARPTKSRALFTQMVGRGTRRHPDKDDLLVLDVVGASREHSLVTFPSLFGFGGDEYPAGLGDGTELLTDALAAHDQRLVLAGKMRAEDADLFARMRGQGVAWVAVHQDGEPRQYQRTCGYKRDGVYVPLPTVVIKQRDPLDDESWLCGLIMPDHVKRIAIKDVSLEMAQGVGEDIVRKVMPAHLVDAGAAWRARKPSPRAVAAAKKWRLPNAAKYRTAGELSDALDAHISRTKERRRMKEHSNG